jgi:hypothetical protein
LATVLADHHVILSRGGTTCIPDEAESCTAVEGSTHVMVEGGVNVGTDMTCADGTADTYGVHVAFTATDGFYTIASQGVGEFRSSGAYAVLVFMGDATLDSPCDAHLTFQSAWTGWLDAGEYNIVVTANDGAAEAVVNLELLFTKMNTNLLELLIHGSKLEFSVIQVVSLQPTIMLLLLHTLLLMMVLTSSLE